MPKSITASDILDKMSKDKKNQDGVKHLILLRSIGDAGMGAEPVTDDLILRILAPGVSVKPKL